MVIEITRLQVSRGSIEYATSEGAVYTPAYGTGGYLSTLVSSTTESQVEHCKTHDSYCDFTLTLYEGSDAVDVRIHRGSKRRVTELVEAELAHFT